MKIVGRIVMMMLASAICLLVLVLSILFIFQRSLIYYPQPRFNLGGSTLMSLRVEGATVQASTRPHSGPGAVIYFGGNAEDVSQNIPELAYVFPSKAIFALHYPGYGGSSGSPTQKAIFDASLALFDQVHAEHPDVIVIGRSLGSGVATWVASQRPVKRLVLVTPFDSLGDVAAQQFRFLPVRWLLRDKFESWRYAPLVNAPTRLIVAEDDKLVSGSSSNRLRTRFHEQLVSYTVLPGFDHNTIQESPDYWALVSRE